jgi:nitrate reductase NapAB chaperone NapD
MNHKLSNQAVGAIMMALQKSLLEQSDIVPTLRGFEVQVDDAGELVVVNPPTIEVPKQDVETSVQ